MMYGDFYELKEIGSGGYGTVYTAKYKQFEESFRMAETVVLKRFKNFEEMPELFISEVSIIYFFDIINQEIFSMIFHLFLFNSSEIMQSA